MSNFDHSKYQQIAFQLITARNQKARRNTLSKNITPCQLSNLGGKELQILGYSEDETRTIRNGYIELAEAELAKARDNDVHVFFRGSEYYPARLTEIYDPPPFIYAKGDISILKAEGLAVVGSRNGSTYGWQSLNRLLPDVCAAGVAIVSGMAYGIDSMAHQIALIEKGKTIGVNAGGLLHLYPVGNKGLIDDIAQRGCIISEFALDVVPRPFYFPIRNRIISGLSRAILVVEAALKSGSLITARLGLEQNRDILAIPGNIDSPLSKGTNYLIQQGARLISSSEDILDEFDIQLDKETLIADFSKKELKILDIMPGNEVQSIDYFVEKLEYSVSECISLLMGLILKNVVIEEAGGYKRIE